MDWESRASRILELGLVFVLFCSPCSSSSASLSSSFSGTASLPAAASSSSLLSYNHAIKVKSTMGLGSVPIFTVETRNASKMMQFGGIKVHNVGANQTWEGTVTKNKLLMKALDSLSEDQIAILIDGGDVIYTGCSKDELMEYYQRAVVIGGGASVVISAELGQQPESQGYQQPLFAERRKEALEKAGMNLTWEDQVANCRPVTFGMCSQPPEYKFLNYGWLMGPVKGLRELLQFVCQDFEEMDQGRAARYFLQHPEKVTLDYIGTLSLSMHQLVKPGDSFISDLLEAFQRNGQTVLRNKMSNETQCFVHGNGWGKSSLPHVSALLT